LHNEKKLKTAKTNISLNGLDRTGPTFLALILVSLQQSAQKV